MPPLNYDIDAPSAGRPRPGAPFQMLSPQDLAQMAMGSFRPPGVMGMQAPQIPQTPGFNVGDGMAAGMAGLGMGLSAMRPQGGLNANAKGMPEDANLGNAVAGINALKPDANGVWQQPPMPTDIGYGQGGSGGNFWQWMKGLF